MDIIRQTDTESDRWAHKNRHIVTGFKHVNKPTGVSLVLGQFTVLPVSCPKPSQTQCDEGRAHGPVNSLVCGGGEP